MSYILEALRRAERERQAGSSVASPASAAASWATRPRTTTMALAGATLFLAGVGVAALLLRTPATTPPPATTEQPVSAPQPALRPTVARIPDATVETRSLPADDAASLDDITPVFQGTPALATPSPVVAPTATAASSGSTAPSAAIPPAAPPRPPTLRELPSELRARFPELVLQVHVHNAEPARRWIMVGNRRLGEGAALDGGVRVVEILSDGVIFEFEGRPLFWPLAR